MGKTRKRTPNPAVEGVEVSKNGCYTGMPGLGPQTKITQLTDHEKKRFVALLGVTGRWAESAKNASVSYSVVKRLYELDAFFKVSCDQALKEYCDFLESHIHRRAIEGVVEKKFGPNGQVIETTKYSDALLMFHAKRHIKEYRDAAPTMVQVQGQSQTQAQQTDLEIKDLTAEQAEHLRALVEQTPPADDIVSANGHANSGDPGQASGEQGSDASGT